MERATNRPDKRKDKAFGRLRGEKSEIIRAHEVANEEAQRSPGAARADWRTFADPSAGREGRQEPIAVEAAATLS